MLHLILTIITAAMTITVLVAEELFLKALTVEFQASGPFTVASHFFLYYDILLLVIYGGENSDVAFLTFLGK